MTGPYLSPLGDSRFRARESRPFIHRVFIRAHDVVDLGQQKRNPAAYARSGRRRISGHSARVRRESGQAKARRRRSQPRAAPRRRQGDVHRGTAVRLGHRQRQHGGRRRDALFQAARSQRARRSTGRGRLASSSAARRVLRGDARRIGNARRARARRRVSMREWTCVLRPFPHDRVQRAIVARAPGHRSACLCVGIAAQDASRGSCASSMARWLAISATWVRLPTPSLRMITVMCALIVASDTPRS